MLNEGWLFDATAAVVVGFVVFTLLAASSLLLGRRAQLNAQRKLVQSEQKAQVRTAFLFDDDVLIDATPAARQLLSLAQRGGSCWTRLMQILRTRFPQVEERLADLLDQGTISITSDDGRSLLRAEWHEGLARLQLHEIDDGSGEGEVQMDRLALLALTEEVELFRKLAVQFPFPAWIETPEGKVTWANQTYLDLSESISAGTEFPVWPPPRLFPPSAAAASNMPEIAASRPEALTGSMDKIGYPSAGKTLARLALELPSGKSKWFELAHAPIDGAQLRVAIPADHVVAAETSRQEFLQTVTKTFASLSLGLAVFDRARRLILFNPALSELTGVAAEFLAQRPSFDDFAEQLRDARILPEPRNFNSWKQRVQSAAADGESCTLAETWALPDGRTYGVQGRPLLDGSIAFLVQDVSSGMRLTRQFRTDLTRHQDILDRLAVPMIIFTDDGNVFAANQAYRDLWGDEAETAMRSAKAIWQRQCPEIAVWDIDDAFGESRSYSGQFSDGSHLRVELAPLPRRAVMLQFHRSAPLALAVTSHRTA